MDRFSEHGTARSLPSGNKKIPQPGKHTKNEMKNHHAINGKTHYKYGHFQ
jgi:hypothetical protein